MRKVFFDLDGSVAIFPTRPITKLKGMLQSRVGPASIEDMEAGMIEGGTARQTVSKSVTGLDTSILFRYILQDDSVHFGKSGAPYRGIDARRPQTISVLASVYRFTNKEIVSTLRSILNKKVMKIQNEPEIYTAMIALQSGQADFANALIAGSGLRPAASQPSPSIGKVPDSPAYSSCNANR